MYSFPFLNTRDSLYSKFVFRNFYFYVFHLFVLEGIENECYRSFYNSNTIYTKFKCFFFLTISMKDKVETNKKRYGGEYPIFYASTDTSLNFNVYTVLSCLALRLLVEVLIDEMKLGLYVCLSLPIFKEFYVNKIGPCFSYFKYL